ncbi:MAG TPA: UDPGP type 1 family protein, partial [Gemmataceae bacterium]|nr:UDPGP type 1 family protein [Gemmataceae bacterium]
MVSVPNDLRDHLRKHGQEHVLTWWDELNDNERRGLLDQLQQIDLDLIHKLYERRDHAVPLPQPEQLAPVEVIRPDHRETAGGMSASLARRTGEHALRQGLVAALVVAGGQGSRLGFEHPKGMYP